jgi:hypothetical protein
MAKTKGMNQMSRMLSQALDYGENLKQLPDIKKVSSVMPITPIPHPFAHNLTPPHSVLQKEMIVCTSMSSESKRKMLRDCQLERARSEQEPGAMTHYCLRLVWI